MLIVLTMTSAVKQQHKSFDAKFDLGEPPIERTVHEAYDIFADSILLRLELCEPCHVSCA